MSTTACVAADGWVLLTARGVAVLVRGAGLEVDIVAHARRGERGGVAWAVVLGDEVLRLEHVAAAAVRAEEAARALEQLVVRTSTLEDGERLIARGDACEWSPILLAGFVLRPLDSGERRSRGRRLGC